MDDLILLSNPLSDLKEEELYILIHDVLGRLLYSVNLKSNNGMFRIQPDLPSGTYIITVQTDTFIEQKKILKI